MLKQRDIETHISGFMPKFKQLILYNNFVFEPRSWYLYIDRSNQATEMLRWPPWAPFYCPQWQFRYNKVQRPLMRKRGGFRNTHSVCQCDGVANNSPSAGWFSWLRARVNKRLKQRTWACMKLSGSIWAHFCRSLNEKYEQELYKKLRHVENDTLQLTVKLYSCFSFVVGVIHIVECIWSQNMQEKSHFKVLLNIVCL